MNDNSESMDKYLKRRKQKKRRRRFVVIPLLFLISFGSFYGAHIFMKAKTVIKDAYAELDRGNKSDKRQMAVDPLKNNISILIMGVDESEGRKKQYGEAVRSDALLLATINKDSKSVKLLSIPRDSRVFIPSKNIKDKIGHAHAYGGVDGTINTIENFLDVPVDYYIKFNFESFTKIVDSLGGIDVDVPITFTEQDSKDQAGTIHLEKGMQHLDGEQALALARTRKIDSDFMRGKRQQLVLEAIAKKALSVGSIQKLGDILDAAHGDIKTNLTFEDMGVVAKNMMGSNLVLDKMQVKCEDQYINGVYYAVPNKQSVDEISNQLKKHLNVTNSSNHKSL